MTTIKRYVDDIRDELDGAKEYAEKFVELKSQGDSSAAARYKEMANDELKHAMYIHDYAVSAIEKLKGTITPPVSMQEAWDKSHAWYVEQTAWIKQMLLI